MVGLVDIKKLSIIKSYLKKYDSFIINEQFSSKIITYEVLGLKAIEEDGVLLLYDRGDIIFSYDNNLKYGFLIDKIDIHFDKNTLKLVCREGYIEIEGTI